MSDILKRDVSGKLKISTHPKFILGFSNIQISQVINHATRFLQLKIFAIMWKFGIYILRIKCSTFYKMCFVI